MSTIDTVAEPARRTVLYGTFDVVVLGGGPAGIAAAVVAGRAGAAPLVIARFGFLGGMGTAAGVTNFCGLHANRFGRMDQVVHGIADDLLDGIARLDGLKEPHTVFGKIQAQAYDTAAYKLAADRLLIDAGVRILFHSLGAGVLMSTEWQIDTLFIETKSGRRAVRSRIFIDGSGDGDLAAWAGAPYELGDGAGSMMFPSTMFRINDVDRDAEAAKAWEPIAGLMQAAARATSLPKDNTPEARRTAAAMHKRIRLEGGVNLQNAAIEAGAASPAASIPRPDHHRAYRRMRRTARCSTHRCALHSATWQASLEQ